MGHNITGGPGIGSERTATPRKILVTDHGAMLLPMSEVIDGSLSRDPGNTGDKDTLRAGMAMGKITSGGKYAPSILGTITVYDAGSDTTLMTVTAATAIELNRRVGSSGTFKLTGPPTAAGTVQTVTVTYSAVNTTTGALTITSLAADVDEVQTITPTVEGSVTEVQTVAITGLAAGNVRIRLTNPNNGSQFVTDALAHDASLATIETAITDAIGTNSVAVGGTDIDAFTLTYTDGDTTWDNCDVPLAEILMDTAATATASPSVVKTTTGQGKICRGAYRLGIVDLSDDLIYTDPIAFDANAAAINTALDAAFGAGLIVATGGPMNGPTAILLTFSGAGYAALAQTLTVVDANDLVGAGSLDVSVTTAAVTATGNDFITGSFVQPTDGSETIKVLIDGGTGIKVTDQDAVSVDVPFVTALIGGFVDFSQIVNVPSDTSLIAYIKDALRVNSIGWAFDDDF